jgi:predicted membrane protein
MSHPKVSKKKAAGISFAVFLIILAIITLTEYWWPGIMLLIGIPLAIKQFLNGRKYDMFITLFVFLGVFVTVQFQIPWKYLLPVIFTIGGIYILFKELFMRADTEAENEESLNKEIEEKEDK